MSDLRELAAALERLRGHGFTESRFRVLLGLPPSDLPLAPSTSIARLRAGRLTDSFFDVLVRLFLIGARVPWSDLLEGFGNDQLDAFLAEGLLERDGDEARAPYLLCPFGEWYVVADRQNRVDEPDYVLAPDNATVAIAALLAPDTEEPRGRALDLGTGSGALALVASRYYGEVWATDVNPRATTVAALNAMLNRVPLNCRQLAAEAASELGSFDLVTFSFPLVCTTPDLDIVAFFSPSGERLLADVYRLLPRLLTDEGHAVFWHQIPSLDAFEAMLVAAGLVEELEVIWNGPIHSGLGWEAGRALVRRRRRAWRPLVCRVEAPCDPGGNRLLEQRTPDLERHLASLDLLERPGSLDDAVPCLSPFTLVSRWMEVADGRLVEGDRVRINDYAVPGEVLEVLRRCDSRATVREIASAPGAHPETRDVIDALTRRGIVFLRPR